MGEKQALEGGCACGAIRYRLDANPLIVHCCHCTWCQRETGTAFALNALIEAARVTLLQGAPDPVATPSASGKGQTIHRCPACRVAVWSNYAGAGDKLHFIRAGTLDDARSVSPDVHIYTSTKHDWVALPEGVPAFEAYYRRSEVWPAESIQRRAVALGLE